MAVGEALRVAGGRGARAGDVDGDRRLRPVVDRRAVEAIVVALEIDALAGPERPNDPHGLAEPREALGELGERHADRLLVERLARADAEGEAAGVHGAERRERLRDDRGVVAEGGGEHGGAERHAGGALERHAEPRDRVGAVAALVPRRLQVVADEEGVEAGLLGQLREAQEIGGAELLGGGLLSVAHASSQHPGSRYAAGGRGRPGFADPLSRPGPVATGPRSDNGSAKRATPAARRRRGRGCRSGAP